MRLYFSYSILLTKKNIFHIVFCEELLIQLAGFKKDLMEWKKFFRTKCHLDHP